MPDPVSAIGNILKSGTFQWIQYGLQFYSINRRKVPTFCTFRDKYCRFFLGVRFVLIPELNFNVRVGNMMHDQQRTTAREIAKRYLNAGDPLGWFEDLYSLAGKDASIIPWADLVPNPNLVSWLDRYRATISGRALKVGSGG